MPELSYREAVRDALSTAMRQDDDVFIMGEDIAEMGGSMGVTHGMLDEFGPERVRNTPISEMALAGAAIGAAMQGMRPIAEIMYEDFMTLAAEQVVNQAAKHRYMSGGQLTVPVVFRTQGGAGWSPGAQHAQQLEAWFVHIPGLKVVFASTPEDVRGLLWSSIYDDNPVVFFEHRTLYGIKGDVPEKIEPIPIGKARVHREGEDVTVIATGRLVHESLAAAAEAEKEGISVEVVDPRTLQPLDEETLVASVKKTNRAVVAHEAVTRMGFGAEVASVLQYQAFDWLDAPIERVGARFTPLPFAPVMESFVIPHKENVLEAIYRTVNKKSCGARGDRGEAPAARPGHGVRDDRQVAQVRRRAGREGRGALRARHRQGDAGGRGRGERRAAEDRDPRRRGRGRQDDRLHRRQGRGRRRRRRRRLGRRRAAAGERRGAGQRREAGRRAEARRRARPRAARPRRTARSRGGRAPRPAAAESGGRIKASPLARRIARERGIELSQLRGTGPDGRIVAEDVERAEAQPADGRRRRVLLPPARSSRVRSRTSARRSRAGSPQAWTVPAFQLTVDADMTRANELVARQRELNPDVRITVTDLLTKVCAQALMRHRDMNVQYTDDALLVFPSAERRHRRRCAAGARRARRARRGAAVDRADRVGARRPRLARARRQAAQRGPPGRHVHDLEPRHVRGRPVHRRAQPAAGIDPRRRRDARAGRSARRRASRAAVDDDDADVRSSRRGRRDRRGLPAYDQGVPRGSRASPCKMAPTVWYHVRDLDEARRFYRETLGFEETGVDFAERWSLLKHGEMEIGLAEGEPRTTAASRTSTSPT